MFARLLPPHTEKVLDGTHHQFGTDGENVEVQVVMRRIAAGSTEEDQFLILATSGLDPEKTTALYEQPWEIETMFAALKSRGYRLEQTHLTEPDRIQRLIGLLALASAWTYLVGQR
ncbi:IS4 transposase [Salinibacter ruber]|uniref:transposase n=1 Tax=Salinibacter ruber TaxID=146919 RepID=UPI0024518B42|nr:IS4 transposase [Salinibacter ruber]